MKSRTITGLIAALMAASAIATIAPSPAAASTAASVTAWELPVRGTPVTRIRALGNIHIRTGPGLNFRVVGTLPFWHTAAVTGISNSFNWWRIRCPWGGTCWMSANPNLTKPIAWRH